MFYLNFKRFDIWHEMRAGTSHNYGGRADLQQAIRPGSTPPPP